MSSSDDLVRGHLAGVDSTVSLGANGLAQEFQRLCRAAAGALSASGVGMCVIAADGTNTMLAASDQATERIEELQFTLGEGPCIDAYATSRPVLVPDLSAVAMNRWPMYTPALHGTGVRAVFAFPLQVGAARLGVFDVFRVHSGPLSSGDLGTALTYAELAVTVLLDDQERATATPDGADGADGLDGAIGYQAELFQAQGMVMVQLGVTLAEAMTRIRARAYAEDRRLSDVAADIVARRLTFDRDRP